nr:energy-coupling factor transporter transmembrane component T [Schaalia sp. lx-260]
MAPAYWISIFHAPASCDPHVSFFNNIHFFHGKTAHNATSFRVDPRTKILALLLTNTLVMGRGPFLLALVCAVLLFPLLASAVPLRKVCIWFTWTFLWAGVYMCAPLLWVGWIPTLTAGLGFWFTRFSVCAGAAWYLISSTQVAHLIAALSALKIPQFFIIPLAVMLRFLPSLSVELHNIHDAMRLRGIDVSPHKIMRHPIRTAEYILVPLLTSTTRMADELSASALLRGLGRKGPHTSRITLRCSLGDIYILCGLCVLVIFYFYGWELNI